MSEVLNELLKLLIPLVFEVEYQLYKATCLIMANSQDEKIIELARNKIN